MRPSESPAPPASKTHSLGFRYWMDRVLEEARNTEQDFAADPVHDLRVALRRCRSMADGFRTIDPDPVWKAMKRAGGRVFRSLGDLRDVQVMRDLVRQLSPAENSLEASPGQVLGPSLGETLDQALAAREDVLKREAQVSLARLDHDQWRSWAEHLAARTARVRLDSSVFQYIALERWHEAYELHRQAVRNRSQASWHSLRVGIKRFRYTVENFLPERHQQWGKDLKSLQDALGEVHDLDILWAQIRAHQIDARSSVGSVLAGSGLRSSGLEDREAVARWRASIVQERSQRIEAYRKKMVGPDSLWRKWRDDLPLGEGQHKALVARAQTLASLSGASVAHARHVMRLALQMHDGLVRAEVFTSEIATESGSARDTLELAAMLQDVGRFRSKHGHHKRSCRMLRKMPAPLDWAGENWDMVAILARYHRGALPEPAHDEFAQIPATRRKQFLHLAAVLRFANALDAAHAQTVKSIRVLRTPETVTLLADGYSETYSHDPETAPGLAIAKFLLETACGLPVVLLAAESNLNAAKSNAAKPNLVVMRSRKAAEQPHLDRTLHASGKH